MSTGVLESMFWVSVLALAHSYVFYGVVLLICAALRQTWRDLRFLLRRRDRRRRGHHPSEPPRIAMLVAAYNEAGVIAAKLHNTAELDYPRENFEFLLGLDCPSDATAAIARADSASGVTVYEFTERRGKLAVVRDLASKTQADILFFSDANTLLAPDCLRRIARHFENPRVGAVCGELRVVSPDGKKEMESAYWRYEVALKFLENRMNCVLGANGAIYAVRRELFDLKREWIVEDFQLPMEIRYSGHRVVYDPEAIGTEESAPDFAAEFRRKVRIGAGAYQTLFGNLRFLNPLRGFLFFAYFSHKVLRWAGPFLMLAAVLTSAALMLSGSRVYTLAFLLQAIFYLLAYAGHLQRTSSHPSPLFSIPQYFVGMNFALFLGFFRYLSGGQKAVWQATPRPQVSVATSAHGEKH